MHLPPKVISNSSSLSMVWITSLVSCDIIERRELLMLMLLDGNTKIQYAAHLSPDPSESPGFASSTESPSVSCSESHLSEVVVRR